MRISSFGIIQQHTLESFPLFRVVIFYSRGGVRRLNVLLLQLRMKRGCTANKLGSFYQFRSIQPRCGSGLIWSREVDRSSKIAYYRGCAWVLEEQVLTIIFIQEGQGEVFSKEWPCFVHPKQSKADVIPLILKILRLDNTFSITPSPIIAYPLTYQNPRFLHGRANRRKMRFLKS